MSLNNTLTNMYKNLKRPKGNENENGIAAIVPNSSDSTVAVCDVSKDEITILEPETEPPVLNSADFSSVPRKQARLTSSAFADKSTPFKTGRNLPKDILVFEHSSLKFSDVGGCETQILEICKLLMHMKHPEVYSKLGVKPPRGFILHGPPGSGKTMMAYAIAGELNLPFIKIASTEIVSGVSGESEQKLRNLFLHASTSAPCILFLDEIDAVATRRETAQREMERRIVAQLLSCLDDLERSDKNVLVIGATSRPDSLDPALRRAGRFDKEIGLGIPDEKAREKILEIVCRGLRLEPNFNKRQLARLTPGYVGADLSALAREACICAIDRVFGIVRQNNCASFSNNELENAMLWLRDECLIDERQLEELFVEMNDFQIALKSVHPSAKREGFATVPDVTWSDIGALGDVRENLKWSILYPIKCPEAFETLNLNSRPQGILLSGPPGCGKTLLAKAVANESGMNFISVKGPELLSMYVGESERAVRQVFQRAKNSAPCVIFFDELDALCPKRSEHESGGSVRVVNQLLTEMDGIESRKHVFLIGATNRPDIIDPAILRPGRLDKILSIGFPSIEDKRDILRAITKNGKRPLISESLNLETIASDSRAEYYTGADLAALVHEAAICALKERLGNSLAEGHFDVNNQSVIEPCLLDAGHFDLAFDRVKPSVPVKEREIYINLQKKYNQR